MPKSSQDPQPNLDYLDQLARGDEAFFQEVKSVLLEELPKERDDYTARIAKRDLKGAADVVHKIKHKVGLLGMESDFRKVQAYEDTLRREEYPDSSELDKILTKMFIFLGIPFDPVS